MGQGTEHRDTGSVRWRAGPQCGHSRPEVKRRQESEHLKAVGQEMPLPKFWLQRIAGSCAQCEDLGLQISRLALIKAEFPGDYQIAGGPGRLFGVAHRPRHVAKRPGGVALHLPDACPGLGPHPYFLRHLPGLPAPGETWDALK